MDWQPIETAPKDHKLVLGLISLATWDVGEGCFSPREDRNIIAVMHREPSFYSGWRAMYDFDLCVEVVPTHWMPLPPPPTP